MEDELQNQILEEIIKFDKEKQNRIFRSSDFKSLMETIRDLVYACEEEDMKEDYMNFASETLEFYLTSRERANTITQEAYREAWEMIPQILFMYLGEVNIIVDLQKTINRFLIFIDSDYSGQDPRLTCAPEKMTKMFDYCMKIIRFLSDTSTAKILTERLKIFAYQDTMESANNGTRNVTKYNHTVALLDRIGNPTKYLLLDERQQGGTPYETNEFGDIVPIKNAASSDKNTESCETGADTPDRIHESEQ